MSQTSDLTKWKLSVMISSELFTFCISHSRSIQECPDILLDIFALHSLSSILRKLRNIQVGAQCLTQQYCCHRSPKDPALDQSQCRLVVCASKVTQPPFMKTVCCWPNIIILTLKKFTCSALMFHQIDQGKAWKLLHTIL